MSSNLLLGVIAAVSVAGLSGAARARPCLLGPDDRPVTTRDAAAPAVSKRHTLNIPPHARTSDPCDVDRPAGRTLLGVRKPLPRMLSPQRVDR